MAATIRLTVLTGKHKGNRYCFREASGAIIGRAPACDVCLCGDTRDLGISRRHCQLAFEAPNICVQDLGSTNGTYVNGHPCPPTPPHTPSDDSSARFFAQDGDILTIGGTSLQISIIECPEAAERIIENCPLECQTGASA